MKRAKDPANAYARRKVKIIEREWAQARAKNPEVILRIHVDDKTDENGNPQVRLVIAP
jgi:hypothetical protein